MSTARNAGPDITIDNSTFNSVNCTSGGAVIHYNGSLTPADYEFMTKFTLAYLHSQTAQAPAVPLPPSHHTPAPVVAHLMPDAAGGTLLIRNSTLNGVNNTCGGVIVRLNKPSQVAHSTNESDHEAAVSNSEADADESSKGLSQNPKGASHSQLWQPPSIFDRSKSPLLSEMRDRRAA